MSAKTLTRQCLIVTLACGNGLGWAQPVSQPLTIYRLNSRILIENDPIWALLKEDSAAGAVGRFGAQIGSDVELARKGYHHRLGRIDFHVRESDLTEGGQGVRSSFDFNLINHLKLDLRNDSPLWGGATNQAQSANILFQVRM